MIFTFCKCLKGEAVVSPYFVKHHRNVRNLKQLFAVFGAMEIFEKVLCLTCVMVFSECGMKVLSTVLKLVCSPLSARDIAWAKNDDDVKKAIRKAHAYMIAKKPQIYFNNINIVNDKINLDLVNTCGHANISIPTNQEFFKLNDNKELVFDIENNIIIKKGCVACARIINFYAVDKKTCEKALNANEKELKKLLNEDTFAGVLAPEKLLYLYSNKLLRIPNFDKTKKFFWDYEIMYIGKVAHGNPSKKHKDRESFLEILESEIEDYEDIRDDVVLLFFDVVERDNSLLVGNSTSINEFLVPLNEKSLPSIETLSVKAENVFVDKFKPKYNAVLFHPYSKNDEDLDVSEYDIIDYAIDDKVTLMFKELDWFGGTNGNCLVYCKNSNLSVMSPADFDVFLEKKFIDSVLSY